MKPFPSLKIGDLEIKVPIVQGGMGVGISGPSLVSAVANAGAVGVLSSAGMGVDLPEYRVDPLGVGIAVLQEEIRQCKENSNGVIGINIMVATTYFSQMCEAAMDAGIDIIFAGAGLPTNLPQLKKEGCATKLIPIVSSGKAAQVIAKKWTKSFGYLPDGFVVEGPLAGGHLGFKEEQIQNPDFALENLVQEVIAACVPFEEEFGRKIPVIAAGGVYTGSDIDKFLKLGAAGVQMGTRFVVTEECDADIAFKNAYLDCKKEDITIIHSPVGMPGRAIGNDFLHAVENGLKHPTSCPFHCIKTCKVEESPYCIAMALLNAKRGNVKHGFVFAGQNAYRTDKIMKVQELIDSLQEEYSLVNE